MAKSKNCHSFAPTNLVRNLPQETSADGVGNKIDSKKPLDCGARCAHQAYLLGPISEV
jgi:hypothetical protein